MGQCTSSLFKLVWFYKSIKVRNEGFHLVLMLRHEPNGDRLVWSSQPIHLKMKWKFTDIIHKVCKHMWFVFYLSWSQSKVILKGHIDDCGSDAHYWTFIWKSKVIKLSKSLHMLNRRLRSPGGCPHLWWPVLIFGGLSSSLVAYPHLRWPVLIFDGLSSSLVACPHLWWNSPVFGGLSPSLVASSRKCPCS